MFPETINVVYHMEELDRIEALVKRYVDVGKRNDLVWSEYKQLNVRDDQPILPKEKSNDVRLSPIRTVETPQRSKEFKQNTASKNTKIS